MSELNLVDAFAPYCTYCSETEGGDMPSGRQIAAHHYERFRNWLDRMTDPDFERIVGREGLALSRTEVARQCGFGRAVLLQNPRIKAALKLAEDGLRERGILPSREYVEHYLRLKKEHAELLAEKAILKSELAKYERLLGPLPEERFGSH